MAGRRTQFLPRKPLGLAVSLGRSTIDRALNSQT